MTMAAGEVTVDTAHQSSPPPPLLDNSPSNLSSPLSGLPPSKDGTPEDMDLDLPPRSGPRLDTPERRENDEEDDDAVSQVDSDGESKLSEPDVNDSEAETERLYDTPPKNAPAREIIDRPRVSGGQHFLERRRDRNFEPSPSKLQQQIRAEAEADRDASDNDSLSDPDDDVSVASSEAEQADNKGDQSRSPSFIKKSSQPSKQDSIPTPGTSAHDLLDTKKRKRSSAAEQLDTEQPLQKRTGSAGVLPDRVFAADDTAVVDEEAIETPLQSGNHTADEGEVDEDETTVPKSKDEPTQSIEDTPRAAARKTAKRQVAKKRKGPGDNGARIDSAPDDGDTATAEEDGQRTAEEEQADADEEAELAHKNEEELERKRAAWEELAAIEKQFANFRERLYQERLDQLNREEAMLMGDNPTHPEYLAMKACIDERRDERIRRSTLELKLRMDLLQRKAVAERSQMMTQYYQRIRASREKVLEQLGQEWYEIQHMRRRVANNIPDYGVRFPTTRQQAIRHAVAYNKEVSILSGVAKYEGFPAAPDIRGATDDQVENDFEAITRTQHEAVRLHHEHLQKRRALEQQHQPPYRETPNEVTAAIVGVPFVSLDPAGEQFLEQTPWANPNHPSHRQSLNHEGGSSVHAPMYAGSQGHRRHSHQSGGNNPFLNGGEASHKSHSGAGHGHERLKGAKMGAEMGGVKRELGHAI